MPLQSFYNVAWLASLAQDALLQSFYIDNLLKEDSDNLLTETSDLYIVENSTTSDGFLLKSDGGRLLLS